MALVFDIKRYAINDGPGIRTTLFVKGCPLRCVWCHNPESWAPTRQILYKKSKCIGCLSCVETCPNDALRMTADGIVLNKKACLSCGKCTEECPSMALELCGKEWTMEHLMAEVEKERMVMEESGGGVTLCGGEPLMHPQFTIELLRQLGRRGFHRVVDTSLFAPREVVEEVAGLCELWLVDLKMMDDVRHRRYTGVSNRIILENIQWLAHHHHDFSIRIPLIEGVNADKKNIIQTACFLHSLPWERRTVHLLPYHDVAKDKHLRMWSSYNPEKLTMDAPSEERLQQCAQWLAGYGLKVIIGG